MQAKETLIKSIRNVELIANKIEAVNTLIPLLVNQSLQNKYTNKLLFLIKKYKNMCVDLKKDIKDYFIIEAKEGNKRSLNLRRLLRSLNEEESSLKKEKV